jgi:branched-chain amino acid transport system ATP-binding protein
MLNVSGIETFYGGIQALHGLSLEIGAGEMVSLLGRNGMGKTTTVRSIMGLTPVRSGTIRFWGRDIGNLPPYRIARLGLGVVPEGRQIFPNLTVRENLMATADDRKRNGTGWRIDDIHALFPVLSDRARLYGSQLSGGEQQMLAIGRALLTNPQLLILDEATEGLAPKIRTQIWRCLQQLKVEGLSLLVIDKHVDALTRICDRHYILEKGRTVWSGTSGELEADRKTQQSYLGI